MKSPAALRFEYFKDHDKTADAYRGDYFTLGDVGYMDDDGFLFLTDRSANLIISGGVNIYPAEIDAVLLTHPAVGDAATIGVPDEEWGEQVKAIVELSRASTPPTRRRVSWSSTAARSWPRTSAPAASTSSTNSRARTTARSTSDSSATVTA